MIKMLRILAFTLIFVAVTAPAQIPPPAPVEGKKTPRRGKIITPPEYDARERELLGKAMLAGAKGQFREAERLYREFYETRPKANCISLLIAIVVDKQGREREAFSEYRNGMRRSDQAWASEQDDPRLLARYADLALRYGTPQEAADAYAFAASRSDRDDFYQPKTVPRTQSLQALRSAAHTAAAIANRNEGKNSEAVGELKIAVSADPSYWVPHFYMAQYLPPDQYQEAIREASLAERLAPSTKARTMIQRVRKGLGPAWSIQRNAPSVDSCVSTQFEP